MCKLLRTENKVFDWRLLFAVMSLERLKTFSLTQTGNDDGEDHVNCFFRTFCLHLNVKANYSAFASNLKSDAHAKVSNCLARCGKSSPHDQLCCLSFTVYVKLEVWVGHFVFAVNVKSFSFGLSAKSATPGTKYAARKFLSAVCTFSRTT